MTLLIPLWLILCRFGHRHPLIFPDLLTNAMLCDMHHYTSGPDCVTMLVPVHEQLYRFKSEPPSIVPGPRKLTKLEHGIELTLK